MRLPVDTRTASGEPARAEPILLRKNADGAGNCTITTKPVPQGQRWRVSYVTVTTTGANAPTVDLYLDDTTQLANLIDGTRDGRSAVAPYNPPRVLTQEQTLIGLWAGADPGAQCTLRVEYDIEVD